MPVTSRLIAIEIDPHEFAVESVHDLPRDAAWRTDLADKAVEEFASGRTYRSLKDAVYDVIEWRGMSGKIGVLLDWLEGTAGITRYAELYD